jgi:predicted dehydrogenase
MQLEHFMDCISNGKQPITSAEDGVAIVRILERAEQELHAARRTPAAQA